MAVKPLVSGECPSTLFSVSLAADLKLPEQIVIEIRSRPMQLLIWFYPHAQGGLPSEPHKAPLILRRSLIQSYACASAVGVPKRLTAAALAGPTVAAVPRYNGQYQRRVQDQQIERRRPGKWP